MAVGKFFSHFKRPCGPRSVSPLVATFYQGKSWSSSLHIIASQSTRSRSNRKPITKKLTVILSYAPIKVWPPHSARPSTSLVHIHIAWVCLLLTSSSPDDRCGTAVTNEGGVACKSHQAAIPWLSPKSHSSTIRERLIEGFWVCRIESAEVRDCWRMLNGPDTLAERRDISLRHR